MVEGDILHLLTVNNEIDSDSQLGEKNMKIQKITWLALLAVLLLRVVNGRESPNSVICSLPPKQPKIQ